jgi:hypothetical protein
MNRDTFHMIDRIKKLGVSDDDAWALRRIAMQLHRWHELECGVDNGGVERDENTGKCYWYSSHTGKRYPTADRETGALKRLSKIMARYPDLSSYVQGDPRGAALYLLYPGCVPAGADPDSYYSRGIAVYRWEEIAELLIERRNEIAGVLATLATKIEETNDMAAGRVS